MRRRFAAIGMAVFLLCGFAPQIQAAPEIGLVQVSETYELANSEGHVDSARTSDGLAGETLYYEISAVEAEPPAGKKPKRFSISNVAQIKRNYELDYQVEGNSGVVLSVSLQACRNTAGRQGVYVAVKLRDTFRNEDPPRSATVTFTLTAKEGAQLIEKSGADFAAVDQVERSEALELSYGQMDDIGNGPINVEAPVLNFSSDADNVTLCFPSEVEVTGNMRNQHNKFLRLSLRDQTLQSLYPYAELFLFDGPEASRTFSREVTLTIPAQPIEDANGRLAAPYLYTAAEDGTLTEPAGVVYNAQDGLFIVTTRTLGRYVVSEEPLKAQKQEQPFRQAEEAPAQGQTPGQAAFSRPRPEPNPQTGR